MLIEMLEMANIHVVSANTDGITCLFDEYLEDDYNRICHEWEKIVGNEELGQLEYVDYKVMFQESINHYIIIKTDGSLKVKGRFDYQGELNKNNTSGIGRIERKAIQEYVKNDTPVEETIKGCTDIFMFCLGLKTSRQYHYLSTDDRMRHTHHGRVVRFFVSKEGEWLYKIKNEESEAKGAKITNIVQRNKVTMFNRSYQLNNFEDYGIDYDFYIDRAQAIIDKIERGGKKKIKVPKEQLSLF